MGSGVLSPKNQIKFLAISLLMWSCEQGIVHEEVVRIPESQWEINDGKNFTWEIPDSTLSYDIYVVLQHNERYAYRNLFLFTNYGFGDSIYRADTLAAFLAKADGQWTGKGSGALISHRFPYLMNKQFERESKLEINVQHGMRDQELEGIEQIGILIKTHLQGQE